MKSQGIAIILAIFFGGLGVHRFYIGKMGTGLLYLLFCWTFIPCILALVDIIRWAFYNDETWSEYTK